MVFPSDTDRAWAAGFFDGEGCFRANRGPLTRAGVHRYYPRATLSQKWPALVHRFRDIVGVGTINYSPARPTSSQAYIWQCSHQAELARVVELLWPWLGEQKRGDWHRAQITSSEARVAADEGMAAFAPQPRTCAATDCDKEFTPPTVAHAGARYCSRVCAARQKRHDEWVPPPAKSCRGCGCHVDDRTHACRRCMTRHWERRRRTAERV